MKKNSNIKKILPLLIFLVLSVVGYKYYEWRVLVDLNRFQRESVLEELGLVDKSEVVHEKSYDEVENFMMAVGSSPSAEVEEAFWSLESTIRLVKSFDKEYYETLVRNDKRLNELKGRGLFLIGSRRDFYEDYLRLGQDYYDKEIKVANNNLINDEYLLHFFEITKDRVILSDFWVDAGLNEQYYIDNFGRVSSIKKYAQSDHRFEKEKEIRELRPKGFEYLDRSRKHLKDSYLLIKDMVAGDVESARYKAEAIDRSSADFNFDMDEIFFETEQKDLDAGRDIAEVLIEKIDLLHDFKNSPLVDYPILDSVDRWEDGAIICNLYGYKTSIYNRTLEKYPEKKSVGEYIDELNQVLPDTSSVDKIADFSDFALKNNEEEVEIKCSSNTSDKTFTYTFKK